MGKKNRRPCYSTKYMRGHSCHYVVLAHSAGDTECQSLNHEHSLYLPLRKTPEDTFRNTGKRPTQGRGVGYEKKITIRTFWPPGTRTHVLTYRFVSRRDKERVDEVKGPKHDVYALWADHTYRTVHFLAETSVRI